MEEQRVTGRPGRLGTSDRTDNLGREQDETI